MKFLPTRLPEVLIVEPDVYRDHRGWFLETYHVQVSGGRDSASICAG